jgi:ribosomal protein L13E
MKTCTEFCIEIANRARELADMPMDSLRQLYPLATNGSMNDIKNATRGFSRGDLIHSILEEEFQF